MSANRRGKSGTKRSSTSGWSGPRRRSSKGYSGRKSNGRPWLPREEYERRLRGEGASASSPSLKLPPELVAKVLEEQGYRLNSLRPAKYASSDDAATASTPNDLAAAVARFEQVVARLEEEFDDLRRLVERELMAGADDESA